MYRVKLNGFILNRRDKCLDEKQDKESNQLVTVIGWDLGYDTWVVRDTIPNVHSIVYYPCGREVLPNNMGKMSTPLPLLFSNSLNGFSGYPTV